MTYPLLFYDAQTNDHICGVRAILPKDWRGVIVEYNGFLINHKRVDVHQLLIELVMSKYVEDNLDPAIA